MAILSKEALLGATDLVEDEVELPALGGSVRVRSLPASFSNDAQSQALEVVTDPRGRQTASVNTRKLEELQVLHGLIDPKMNSIEEVQQLGEKLGPSWRQIVDKIDSLSGVNKQALEDANRAFQSGGSAEAGISGGNGSAPAGSGSDRDVRVGTPDAHVGA